MATIDLSVFKNIPQRQKDLIYGYIRKIQAIFPKDNTYYNIPDSVNYICALFYHLKDKWDPKYIGANHKLSNDGYSLTIGGGASSSYGTVIVKSPEVYRWKFKIHKAPANSHWNLVLGVWKIKSADKPVTDTHFTNSTNNKGTFEWGYAVDLSYGNLIEVQGSYSNGPEYGSRCKDGDVVEMVLDLKKFTLGYKINDNDFGPAFKEIEDTEYRVACSSEWHNKHEIEMLQ